MRQMALVLYKIRWLIPLCDVPFSMMVVRLACLLHAIHDPAICPCQWETTGSPNVLRHSVIRIAKNAI